MSQAETYVIIDKKTKRAVSGEYQCKRRARRRVDKLDNAYGCYQYRVITMTEFKAI